MHLQEHAFEHMILDLTEIPFLQKQESSLFLFICRCEINHTVKSIQNYQLSGKGGFGWSDSLPRWREGDMWSRWEMD